VEKNSIPPEDVASYYIGSVLSGGGGNPTPNDVQTWREMVQVYMAAALQTRLAIPLIYGVDAVHGHNNVVGATIFPHNVGLGATRDADLVERIGRATASEVLATNVHWNFAPAVSVPQDFRWGRTYEGFSEDTDLVGELGVAYVRGLQMRSEQGDWVLASVKHFAGDGGTEWDSRVDGRAASAGRNWQAANVTWRIDQGDTRIDEATLRRVHLAPYKQAVDAGAENIMVSFSSWNGVKMHAHEYLLTQVLKGEWGFEGFLVSDWMAVSQLADDYYQAVVMSINAGLDMVMVPYDYKAFIANLKLAVKKGDVALARIDDAVRRILRAKFRLGLFERCMTDETYLAEFGGAVHRALAREAVQKSLVLLKNDQDALPLREGETIAVAGQGADDIGLACGGWTITWQGEAGAITEGSTLLEGLRAWTNIVYSADGEFSEPAGTAIVVVAEQPTAEGEGDREDLSISTADTALIERVRGQCERLILVVYSGRPLIITHVAEQCDAIIAAWLPGSEADGIADVLFGDVPFTGKLAFTWIKSMDQLPLRRLQASGDAPLWAFGHGLTIG
jgi:beta-glucosidase